MSNVFTVAYAKQMLSSNVPAETIRKAYATAPLNVQREVYQLLDHTATKIKVSKEEAMEVIKTALDKRFIIYRDEHMTPNPLEIVGPNLVSMASEEHLRLATARATREYAGRELESKAVIEIVKSYMVNAEFTRDLPKSFTLDPNELAFTRISINMQSGPCPTWDNFIDRCGVNGRAVEAYVWSIFDPRPLQQYLLFKGEGSDGKGSLFRWIQNIVTDRACSSQSVKDDHWLANCVGKRVVIWPDVANTTFTLSDNFKSATGGDFITVTNKYKTAYSTKLDCRYFVSTNNDASVTTRKSDMRRLLYCEVQECIPMIPEYEEKLASETSAILFKCKQAFEELYDPKFKNIKNDQTLALEQGAKFETNFSAILENQFELGPEFKVTREQVHTETEKKFKYKTDHSEFRNWLKRTHGITEKKMKDHPDDKVRRNYLIGIKIKTGERQ